MTCFIKTRVKNDRTAGLLLAILLSLATPGFAQVDLSGSWAARNHEDALERGPGPFLVDYTGIPLNADGRERALEYSASMLSMPERVCLFYPPTYLLLAPHPMRMWSVTDPDTGKTIAWKIGSWEDMAELTIWMDGRPHPSKYAPHTKAGFTTGVWEGDVLTTYTTHMKEGIYRRNGAIHSDEATLTEHFLRHGDLLTVTGRVEDPLYLSEPMYWTRSFQLSPVPVVSVGPPCIRGDEGPPEGVVPHYLPGKNPFVDEVPKLLGIPVEGVLGGAETLYPEFHRKIKDEFVVPKECTSQCGGPPPGQ